MKLWTSATRELSEEHFDCTAAGLRDFLQLIHARAIQNGWDVSILAVPEDIADPLGPTKYLEWTNMET